MIKDHYLQELEMPGTQSRSGRATNSQQAVKKIQEWLNLYEFRHPGVGTATMIDGDFGPATERAVKNFQIHIGKSPTGIVSKQLFGNLTDPLEFAFQTPGAGNHLRDKITSIAMNHLLQFPKELTIGGQSNSGPWVRSYMDGNQGAEWFWCMGFVQTIFDQAFSELGGRFTDFMPKTLLCDTLGNHATSNNHINKNDVIKANPSLIKKGDIFLLKTANNPNKTWFHTGIIVNANDDIIQTIEGNTDELGSSNGNGVYSRIRNFRKSNIDVVSLQQIAN
jgi:peptidoglycan hydrolase-like protein with peptidoglycan-binding domain